MNIFRYFTKKARHIRACEKAGFPAVYEVFSGKFFPVMKDSSEADEKLSLREINCIYKSECPDCGGEIRWGPSAPGFQNVKCFGLCGAKFNAGGQLSYRFEDKVTG